MKRRKNFRGINIAENRLGFRLNETFRGHSRIRQPTFRFIAVLPNQWGRDPLLLRKAISGAGWQSYFKFALIVKIAFGIVDTLFRFALN